MKEKTRAWIYDILLALSAVFALGAILTLVPDTGAPWPNLLGYKSMCAFAPGSTLACALLAAITCRLRSLYVKRAPLPLFVSAAAILLLAGALVWSTAAWVHVKEQYADSTSSATARR